MKTKLLAIGLLALTGGGIALAAMDRPATGGMTVTVTPPARAGTQTRIPEARRVEVVFVLDTTGSMGGLIHAAKEKIWSIATTLASARQQPEVRVGLVAFRDRGDRYVTRVTDLSTDLDAVYATLMDFTAEGGGDGPESVNAALHDAVHRISWSQDAGTYRAVFLVGDAPPHMDYQDDVKYPQTVAEAGRRGIVVNAVQAGSGAQARMHWQRIAQLGAGAYASVTQDGNAVAIATPFDASMAALSRKLDATRMYYGDRATQRKMEARQKAARKVHEEASVASKARRATFNVSGSGKRNLIGDSELVDDVASGRIELDSVASEHLPASLKDLDRPAQAARIKQLADTRATLKKEIEDLAQKRQDYLRAQVAEAGGEGESLDRKLFDAMREQAGRKGLEYDESALKY
jgi:uncharacterized protein YegL